MKKEHLLEAFKDWLSTIPSESIGINLDVVEGARFHVGTYMRTSTVDVDDDVAIDVDSDEETKEYD